VEIRPATLDDAAELVRLGGIMYASMGMNPDDPEWRDSAQTMVRERLRRDMVAFVIDDPDRPGHIVASGAGTIAIRLPAPTNHSGRVGYVQWIATEPAFRRRGYARAITAALVEWFERAGVKNVELHATKDAEPMYRQLGFSEGPNAALRRTPHSSPEQES
jgi:GNAT superfamily N-acetyltransferase